jgi:hypothetical protein
MVDNLVYKVGGVYSFSNVCIQIYLLDKEQFMRGAIFFMSLTY